MTTENDLALMELYKSRSHAVSTLLGMNLSYTRYDEMKKVIEEVISGIDDAIARHLESRPVRGVPSGGTV